LNEENNAWKERKIYLTERRKAAAPPQGKARGFHRCNLDE